MDIKNCATETEEKYKLSLKSNTDRYHDLKGLAEYSSLSVRTLRDYLSDINDPIPSFWIKKNSRETVRIWLMDKEIPNWFEKD